MNILVLLKSTYARLIGTFGVNLNRIYVRVIHIALSKHGLPVLCDVNELQLGNHTMLTFVYSGNHAGHFRYQH